MSSWQSEMTPEEWESVMGVPYSHISPEQQEKNREFSEGFKRGLQELFTKEPLTEQEYIDKGGVACPNCHSTEGICSPYSPDGVSIDYGIAWQEIHCSLCKANWTDNYNLVGYSGLWVLDNDSSK